MPTVNLSNDEYHAILTARTNAQLIGGYCEDYPCCGHTQEDPCTREWYDHPDAFNPLVNPHCFCEHEYGMCEVDDYGEPDPATCEHEPYFRSRGIECAYCDTPLVPVTDQHERVITSKAIPGLRYSIIVLGIVYEARR